MTEAATPSGGMPPPPPPVVPVPSVDAARILATDAIGALESTIERARTSFDEDERHRGVNGEWSTVQSLRHLVLVVDLWLSKSIGGVEDPFHPMALPPSFMPPALPGTSIDPAAQPSFDEAAAVLTERLASVRAYVDGRLTDDELQRPVPNHAATVGGALNVLFTELAAHDGFVNRDLDVIEAERS